MDLITQQLMLAAGGKTTIDPNTGITWSNVNYGSLNNPDIWTDSNMNIALVTSSNSLVIAGGRSRLAIGGSTAYTDPANVYDGFRALGLSDNNIMQALLETGAATHNYWAAITHAPNGTANLTGGAVSIDDGATTITLPFSVNFFGVSYTKITVNSNGIVYFGDGSASGFNGDAVGYFNEARSVPHIALCLADMVQDSLWTGSVSGKFIVRVGGYNYPDVTSVPYLYELHFYNGANYFDLHFVTAPSSQTQYSNWNNKLTSNTSGGYNQVGGATPANTGYSSYTNYNTDYPIQFFIKSGVSYRINTVSAITTFTPGTGTLFAISQYTGYGGTSTDGGYNWIQTGYAGGAGTFFYNGKKVFNFAIYGSGDYESVDAGKTWTASSPKDYAWSSTASFFSNCFSAASQNVLFAASGDISGSYTAIVSKNGGQTWENVGAALASTYYSGNGNAYAGKYVSGTAWNGTEFLIFFTNYSANADCRIIKFNPTSQTYTYVGLPLATATSWGTASEGEICAASTTSYYDGTAVYRAGPYGVLRSSNGGTTWAKVQGGQGFNQVFKYNSLWVGLCSSYGAYSTSTDGITWTQANTSKSLNFDSGSISGRNLYSSAYNGSQYIVGGDTGRCATSTDGITWTNQPGLNTAAANRSPLQFMWDGARWWAALEYNNIAFSSNNGVTWTGIDLYGQFGQSSINTIAYGNGIYMIGSTGGQVATSTITGSAYATGAGWTSRSSILQATSWATANIQKIIYDSSYFIAVGSGGNVAISANGTSWQNFTNVNWSTNSINDIVAVGNSTYVIVGDSGKVAKIQINFSTPSITWTVNSYIYTNMTGGGAPLTKVAYNGTRLITTSNTVGGYLIDGGKIFYSDDLGTTWADAKLMDSGWFDDQFYGYYRAVNSLTVGNKNKFLITGQGGSMAHSPYEITDKPTLVTSTFSTSGNSFVTQLQSVNFNAANNNLIQKNDFVIVFARYDDAGTTADLNITRYNNGFLDKMSATSQVTVSSRQGSRVFYSLISRTNGLEYFTVTTGGVSVSNLELRVLVYRPGTNKLIVFNGTANGQAGFTNTVTTQTFTGIYQDGVVVNFISGYYGVVTIGTATYTVPAGTTKIGTDSQFSSHSHVFRTSRQTNQSYTWNTNQAYMGAISVSLKQY
jgi:hypothetical protein